MRSLILLPGERSRYLLARNLSRLPHLGGVALVMTLALAAAALFAAPEQTPSALEAAYVIATALVLLPQTYFLLCIVGNVVSMYFPYHIKSDTMRQRASGKAAGAGLAQLLLTPLFIGPAMLCASLDRLIELIGGPRLLGPSLAASAALLVVTLFAYRWSLGPLGRLLMRREQAILNDLLRGKE
jgi:hypothetical protein